MPCTTEGESGGDNLLTHILFLSHPDDAVSTILNPTEDYKTSVLSGLDPNTVMECAGRALGFWAYQSTQEIFYQEFLGKSLTEKYTSLNMQMDRVVLNANSEISNLHSRLSDLQAVQEQLQKKNQELVDLYREKSTKLTQMTNLYNILKARAMRSPKWYWKFQTVGFENLKNYGNASSKSAYPKLAQSADFANQSAASDSSSTKQSASDGLFAAPARRRYHGQI
ncbi:uncharacterized protein N7484_005946 [Penicillium longicatenatum]|uniref:uncharacterized protein n=1 Tax=Penicillium longicatenatum TaxID=1561947 RepID=UPI0025489D96|nr:uncharacterized protein N7484_005946 [Penicillium longicatenatum]KAJ5643439.1 hypothetical protein N7484_005946 [Penicillium longicatenatum]